MAVLVQMVVEQVPIPAAVVEEPGAVGVERSFFAIKPWYPILALKMSQAAQEVREAQVPVLPPTVEWEEPAAMDGQPIFNSWRKDD